MRFRIAWRNGAYKVNRPEYDGGEVVDAEDYDRLRETMLRCADKLETFGNEEPLEVAAVLRADAKACEGVPV